MFQLIATFMALVHFANASDEIKAINFVSESKKVLTVVKEPKSGKYVDKPYVGYLCPNLESTTDLCKNCEQVFRIGTTKEQNEEMLQNAGVSAAAGSAVGGTVCVAGAIGGPIGLVATCTGAVLFSGFMGAFTYLLLDSATTDKTQLRKFLMYSEQRRGPAEKILITDEHIENIIERYKNQEPESC